MIESLGYTNDGFVWINFNVDHEGQRGTMVATFSVELARKVARDLLAAANNAEEKLKGMTVQ